MPLPENVKLQISLNGGAAQVGGITANHGDVVVASLLEPAGVAKARYEIYEYPEGFTVPAGWTHDVDSGVYFFFSANGAAAPPFTLPASTTLWGKWLLSVEVNNRMRSGELADDLFDSTTALSIVSPGGLVDTAFRENQQFGGVRQWAGEIKKNWRLISTLTPGEGGADPLVKVVTAAITSNQNDLSPSGWAAAFASPAVLVVLRFTTDASRNITGLAAPPTPPIGWAMPVKLINAGSFPAVWQHQNASSTAANRLLNQGALDVEMLGDDTLTLLYDFTSARWRPV